MLDTRYELLIISRFQSLIPVSIQITMIQYPNICNSIITTNSTTYYIDIIITIYSLFSFLMYRLNYIGTFLYTHAMCSFLWISVQIFNTQCFGLWIVTSKVNRIEDNGGNLPHFLEGNGNQPQSHLP